MSSPNHKVGRPNRPYPHKRMHIRVPTTLYNTVTALSEKWSCPQNLVLSAAASAGLLGERADLEFLQHYLRKLGLVKPTVQRAAYAKL